VARTTHVAGTETETDLQRLNRLRLDRDWTYEQLADDMARRGLQVPSRTVYALLTNPPAKPYERTLHKIRCYLAAVDAASAKAAAR
jgi:hypothetical protein